MATPHQDSSTPATTARTVPVGQKDPRSMNTVLLYGIGTFAAFAVLFVLLDLVNGHL
ncbi:hypothetical protein [Ornithinimicrobium flavum]|uniref:hypothetical protein n=1 Tax=Ornithinimicrobium flavum TaxID=1288636 RepID=UPI0013050AE2|nr:hypothetical protein [Ornithinimicrobium flavum]